MKFKKPPKKVDLQWPLIYLLVPSFALWLAQSLEEISWNSEPEQGFLQHEFLEGMDQTSNLISIDFDDSVLSIAQQFLGTDPRLKLELIDGEKWVEANREARFDSIFADNWHGKYLLLDEVLEILNIGGLYIVDDMLPQTNWPEGQAEKAEKFIEKLESCPFLNITKLNWSTGIIVDTRMY